MRTRERRSHRSEDALEALRLQLETCRSAAALDGMVLSDEDGIPLASVGDVDACDEIAARLPLIGRRIGVFEGVLLSAENGWRVRVRSFVVGASELYLAAIGGDDSEDREKQIRRGLGGASRILSAA